MTAFKTLMLLILKLAVFEAKYVTVGADNLDPSRLSVNADDNWFNASTLSCRSGHVVQSSEHVRIT